MQHYLLLTIARTLRITSIIGIIMSFFEVIRMPLQAGPVSTAVLSALLLLVSQIALAYAQSNEQSYKDLLVPRGRPDSITILSALFGLAAIAGALNAIVILASESPNIVFSLQFVFGVFLGKTMSVIYLVVLAALFLYAAFLVWNVRQMGWDLSVALLVYTIFNNLLVNIDPSDNGYLIFRLAQFTASLVILLFLVPNRRYFVN